MKFRANYTMLELKSLNKMQRVKLREKLFAFPVLMLVLLFLCSEDIPEDSHLVNRTTVISNCSDFPEIAFIARMSGTELGEDIFYEISDNMSLYKEARTLLQIFGIKRTTLAEMGGVSYLTTEFVLAKVQPQRILCTSSFYVDNRSLYSGDEVYYEIIESGGVYFANIKKRVVRFSDGSSEVIDY